MPRIRPFVVAAFALLGLLAGPAGGPPALAAPAVAPSPFVQVVDGEDPCRVPLDGDPRLGPATLPTTGPVGRMVAGYRRFGDLTKEAFLARYWDPTASGGRGSFIFPPDNGYLMNIVVVATLNPGTKLDRYGSEFGSFLAPAFTAYARRSIPPQSLNTFDPAYPCNYHAYQVLKPFRVRLGPIAPWFEQPGRGVQDQLDAVLVPGAPTPMNVQWLVDNGYLQRLN